LDGDNEMPFLGKSAIRAKYFDVSTKLSGHKRDMRSSLVLRTHPVPAIKR